MYVYSTPLHRFGGHATNTHTQHNHTYVMLIGKVCEQCINACNEQMLISALSTRYGHDNV